MSKLLRMMIVGSAIGLLIPSNSVASDWEYLGTSKDNSDYYIDKSSVRDAKDLYTNIRSGWLKTDDSANADVEYRESKLLYFVKCESYEIKLVQYINYGSDGKVMGSSDSYRHSSYSVAAPETVGYAILSAICWGL